MDRGGRGEQVDGSGSELHEEEEEKKALTTLSERIKRFLMKGIYALLQGPAARRKSSPFSGFRPAC